MSARIQTIPTGGGGGGGGSNCFSREVRTSFSSRNEWQLMIFMGRSGSPAPSVSAHIGVSIVRIHILFIYYFFAGPLSVLIISADAKGKDSMILFKIKETAHINFRPRVVCL